MKDKTEKADIVEVHEIGHSGDRTRSERSRVRSSTPSLCIYFQANPNWDPGPNPQARCCATVGKKPFSLQQHGSACDLGTALECFQGVVEGLGTSLKLFEGFVCGARVKSLQQGPGPRTLARGEEREHKHFVTFRESSQKVLEPSTWLGSGWRILKLCVGSQLKPFGHAMAWDTFNANQSRIGFFRQLPHT
ncbi:hypothetical protein B0H14DRAFT_2613779 [Mycena olivaceomarginata]|nr:hypothetical protein B0H14DRAFT_2613779 [Mycena olivaceomarginata]